jgi:hypothetical protein
LRRPAGKERQRVQASLQASKSPLQLTVHVNPWHPTRHFDASLAHLSTQFATALAAALAASATADTAPASVGLDS